MRCYLFCLLVILSISGLMTAEDIEFRLDFPFPAQVNCGSYARLEYADCAEIEHPGIPLLPYRGINLLLPPGHEADHINISDISYFPEKLNLRLIPGSQPVPISMRTTKQPTLLEGEVYRTASRYPATPVSKAVTHYKNGHPVASFTISPVIYYPIKDSVTLIKSITLILDLKPTNIDPAMYKHNPRISAELLKLIDNPQNLRLFSDSSTRINVIDILVITSSDFSSCFTEYLEYKASCGLSSVILTTEEIYNTYNGEDAQQQIRNAIIDHYQRFDVQYVLLGGDSSPVNNDRNIIPHRGFFGDVGGYSDFDIPSDMYYCCLDGNWNDDGDSLWGEFEESDYLEEVSIGRISGANAFEISHQLHKLLFYQSVPVVNDLQKCLLAGKQVHTLMFGGQYLEEIAEGCDNWGYTTVGIADNITITRLYEMYENWDAEDLFEVFNTGTNIVSNMSHGSTTNCFDTTTEQLITSNITNDGITHGYFHCYSQACYVGAFDNRLTSAGVYVTESYAEKLSLLETGAASFIANSRYGWFSAATTNGVSQRYAREFYDTIFDDNILVIGKINSIAKEKNLAFLDESLTHRWTYCNLNLLGDPSLPLYTASPENIEITFPDILTPGNTEIPYFSSENNLQYAVMMNTEMLGHGNTGFLPCSLFPLQNAIPEPGMLDIYANKPGFWQFHTQIEVVSPEWALVVNEIELSDANGWNPNGIPEYSENINVSFKFSNAGTNSGGNVEIELCSIDNYLSFMDSLIILPCPAPGESIMLQDTFCLLLSGDIPDMHDVMLIFQILLNDQVVQEYHHEFRVSAPVLELQEFTISDNNNNILDPGETVTMEIALKNSGHADSPETTIELFCSHPLINIPEFLQNLGIIPADEIRTASFEISAAVDINAGEMIEFIMISQSGEYQLLQYIEYYVGVETESFESNDFLQFDWYFPLGTSWEIAENACDGRYSASTPDMGNCCARRMSLDFESNQDGYISFWFKTDTFGTNIGNLEFYLNSSPAISTVSGDNDWTRLEAFVPAGLNLFEWTYFTHTACDSRLWLDKIIFPPREFVTETKQDIITSPGLKIYPNPFNPETRISFYAPENTENAKLNIYNIKGQLVSTLFNGNLSSGIHNFTWNANNQTSSIYFIHLSAGEYSQSIKAVLLK